MPWKLSHLYISVLSWSIISYVKSLPIVYIPIGNKFFEPSRPEIKFSAGKRRLVEDP